MNPIHKKLSWSSLSQGLACLDDTDRKKGFEMTEEAPVKENKAIRK